MARTRSIVLLLGAAIAGGLVLAGETTGSLALGSHSHFQENIRPDNLRERSRAFAEGGDPNPSDHGSWLARGLALIEGPAWPFGQDQWDQAEHGDDPGSDDNLANPGDDDFNAPPGAVDRGDDGDPGEDAGVGPEDGASPALAENLPLGSSDANVDAAAESARRAAQAAQDVDAAEQAH